MKTIGLLGGMSWESTAIYYSEINKLIAKEKGGFHSAKCILYSFDFHEIEECMKIGNWERITEILINGAFKLEQGGVDFIVICTNTMHKVADEVQSNINVPILHIADVIADALIENNIKKVALLGTKYTMEQDFYRSKLIAGDIEVIIPELAERNIINKVIFEELCLGIISHASKNQFLTIINDLASQGAEGIILGCTEIGILVKQEDTKILLFDTTYIHARRAARYALG